MKGKNKNTNLTLLNVGYAVHHADWNYQHVNSPFARIYLVKEGEAYLNFYDRIQKLLPDHLYIIPPFTLHSYECNSFFALYYIHIYEDQFDGQLIFENYNFPSELPSSPLTNLLVERLFQINAGKELFQYDPVVYDNPSTLLKTIALHSNDPIHTIMETKGILLQLLSMFIHGASQKLIVTEERIKKVLRLIREQINEPVKIENLAKKCYLSKDHFIRLFKKELGVTPTKYINQKKIERAQLQLITTDLSVQEIAYGLSFEDVSYFNRLFKQHANMTPKEYRRKT